MNNTANMIRSSSGQRGMTFIGFAILMTLIGFFALLGLKLVPIYLEHYKVVSILKNLESDKELVNQTREDILRTMEKRWNIDMIESVTKENVAITKDMNYVKVEISYDVTKPILGNVDALVHFYDFIEVNAN